jgi:curved DNA-binding protein
MKYKDYYACLGVERGDSLEVIKRAYRKLARKYHPDVSKEVGAEEKFKDIAEAWRTLKDTDQRAAYDQLGVPGAGRDFEPPPEWQQQFGEEPFAFDQSELGDLLASLRGRRPGARGTDRTAALPGQDFEVAVHITLDEAFRGSEVRLNLQMPEYDLHGRLHRVPLEFKARIPKGATDGQRMRVPGKGGGGFQGGRAGDLYLNIVLHAHPLFRVDGHDLYFDLPLTPWEAVLGAALPVPTLDGPVRLRIPAGTQAGRHLRLAKRGLPKPGSGEGDLFAMVQIVVPTVITEHERALFQQLADASTFDPRAHFGLAGGSK